MLTIRKIFRRDRRRSKALEQLEGDLAGFRERLRSAKVVPGETMPPDVTSVRSDGEARTPPSRQPSIWEHALTQFPGPRQRNSGR